jgi:hypothetical protein
VGGTDWIQLEQADFELMPDNSNVPGISTSVTYN